MSVNRVCSTLSERQYCLQTILLPLVGSVLLGLTLGRTYLDPFFRQENMHRVYSADSMVRKNISCSLTELNISIALVGKPHTETLPDGPRLGSVTLLYASGLYVFGGTYSNGTWATRNFKYDMEKRKWFSLPGDHTGLYHTPRVNASGAVIHNHVAILLGGVGPRGHIPEHTDVFDLATEQWLEPHWYAPPEHGEPWGTNVPPVSESTIVQLGDYIWVGGGVRIHNVRKEINAQHSVGHSRQQDISTSKDSSRIRKHSKIIEPAVLSPRQGFSGEVLDSVNCSREIVEYDTVHWPIFYQKKVVALLPESLRGHRIALYALRILFVIGGQLISNGAVTNKVWFFKEQLGWKPYAPLHYARSHHSVIVVGDGTKGKNYLFVFGGFGEDGNIVPFAEVLDLSCRSCGWRVVNLNLLLGSLESNNFQLAGSSMHAVYSGNLPNARLNEYTIAVVGGKHCVSKESSDVFEQPTVTVSKKGRNKLFAHSSTELQPSESVLIFSIELPPTARQLAPFLHRHHYKRIFLVWISVCFLLNAALMSILLYRKKKSSQCEAFTTSSEDIISSMGSVRSEKPPALQSLLPAPEEESAYTVNNGALSSPSTPTQQESFSFSSDLDTESPQGSPSSAPSPSPFSDNTSRSATDYIFMDIAAKSADSSPTLKFTRGHLIGRGAHGKVFKAFREDTGTVVALKVIPLKGKHRDRLSLKEAQSIVREVNLMRELPEHRNLIKYYGCQLNRNTRDITIAMEYAEGGSLSQMCRKLPSGGLSKVTLQSYATQILSALKHLHNHQIVHRDLKGDNVLISKTGVLKVADFGTAKKLVTGSETATITGTPLWMAPEAFHGVKWTYNSDVWSFGCTIVEMLNGGRPPWRQAATLYQAMQQITETSGLPPNLPTELDPLLADFLLKCFERDSEKRATVEQLLEHAFLRGTEPTAKSDVDVFMS